MRYLLTLTALLSAATANAIEARDNVQLCQAVLVALKASAFCSSFVPIKDVTLTSSVPGKTSSVTTTTTVPTTVGTLYSTVTTLCAGCNGNQKRMKRVAGSSVSSTATAQASATAAQASATTKATATSVKTSSATSQSTVTVKILSASANTKSAASTTSTASVVKCNVGRVELNVFACDVITAACKAFVTPHTTTTTYTSPDSTVTLTVTSEPLVTATVTSTTCTKPATSTCCYGQFAGQACAVSSATVSSNSCVDTCNDNNNYGQGCSNFQDIGNYQCILVTDCCFGQDPPYP